MTRNKSRTLPVSRERVDAIKAEAIEYYQSVIADPGRYSEGKYLCALYFLSCLLSLDLIDFGTYEDIGILRKKCFRAHLNSF